MDRPLVSPKFWNYRDLAAQSHMKLYLKLCRLTIGHVLSVKQNHVDSFVWSVWLPIEHHWSFGFNRLYLWAWIYGTGLYDLIANTLIPCNIMIVKMQVSRRSITHCTVKYRWQELIFNNRQRTWGPRKDTTAFTWPDNVYDKHFHGRRYWEILLVRQW